MLNIKYNIAYTNERGFSVMETIIAVFIFSLVAMSATAAFLSANRTQNRSNQAQRDLENLRVAIDLIGKTMRMSSFVVGDGTGKKIYMYNNSENRCVSFFIDEANRRLEGDYDESVTNPDDCDDLLVANYTYNEITSVGIDTGKFDVIPTTASPANVVGRATIMLKAGDDTLQTTVSFRDFENL